MTDNAAEQGDPEQKFMRHGILGWYAGTAAPQQSAEQATTDILQSLYPVCSESGPGFELSGTGGVHPLPRGGAVVIAGHPSFRDTQLSELARSQGNAAAVAAAYALYSQDVFSQVFGAFCCAIIDNESQQVLAAIDRLGQHSLYYRCAENKLVLGTSASEVLACDGGSARLQAQGLYNYLYFHMVPCPDSTYEGLNKLQAGHYLHYRDGQCELVNYWQPSFSESAGNETFAGLGKQLQQALRESVQNCMPESGKIGCFLSGGLDSSTVTGVLAELSDQQAQAYSIGFSAEGYDEMAFARITAKHFGVHLNEYYVTPQDVVDALPRIATSYDEPFGNSSALPAYFCAKMAAENGVTTLLGGDGGDELFAGNERYLRQGVFEHYAKVPGVLRKSLLEPLLRALPNSLPLVGKANSYVEQANTPLPDRLQSYNFLHRHAASEIFTDDFLEDVDTQLPLALQRAIYHRPPQATDLNRMLYLDWQITLADNDLRKVSHTCALAGVEVTYPMLDDTLVEFSCRVPSAWKMQGGDLRHFYKEALKDWLPSETINKSKQGFGLPFGVWMQTYAPLREMAYDNLLKLKARGFIRPEFIDKTIQMHQSEHAAYYGELVWIFTVFELWLDAHSGRAAVATEA